MAGLLHGSPEVGRGLVVGLGHRRVQPKPERGDVNSFVRSEERPHVWSPGNGQYFQLTNGFTSVTVLPVNSKLVTVFGVQLTNGFTR